MLSVLLPATAGAATLSLTSATPEIFVGESIDVDLVIGALDPAGSGPLGAFDVNVSQTPDGLLGFDAHVLGTALGDPLFESLDVSLGAIGGGIVNVAQGNILLLDPDLIALQSASFRLATLSFTAGAAPGTTTLSVSNAVLSDSLGVLFIDVTGTADLLVTVREREAGVDEPAVLGLLLGGLLLVSTARNRRSGPAA